MKAGPYFERVHAARAALSKAMLALNQADAAQERERVAVFLLTLRRELVAAQAQLRVLQGEPLEEARGG